MSLPSWIRPSVPSDDLSVPGMPPKVIPETPLPPPPASSNSSSLSRATCQLRTATSSRVCGRFAAPTDVHQNFKELLLFVCGGGERESNSSKKFLEFGRSRR
ncbi:hypothetical protein CDAR_479821 [Caerostris darwini]|uniref:Uncharacterized protein n=1 Tax=Caerostris darwini TaxID=1538125 RepID=A0AAV4SS54_9ARAC|nr:hypothetical protein CDAR_479821 [Caerostris darwini]